MVADKRAVASSGSKNFDWKDSRNFSPFDALSH